MQKIMNWEKHLTVGVIVGLIGQMFWTPLFWLFVIGIILFEIVQALLSSVKRDKTLKQGILIEMVYYFKQKWIDSIADILFGFLGYLLAIIIHAILNGNVL